MTVISLLLALVVLPAVIGYCLYSEAAGRGLHLSPSGGWRHLAHEVLLGKIEPGDFLIYRKQKVSPRPGPRARNVEASEHGDDYYYEVDKFWAVRDVLEDGRVVAVTRTGKQVYLTREDERLRKAGIVARLRYRTRFPAL